MKMMEFPLYFQVDQKCNMNNKPIMYVFVGISGAGKSTYIEQFKSTHPDAVLFSSDKLRGIIGRNEDDQSVTPQVFSIMKRNSDTEMAKGKNVIIDATNLNAKDRKSWVEIAKKHNATLIAYVMERSKDLLMSRQKIRGAAGGRVVPEDVIDRMLQKYVRPSQQEGFDQIILR